MNGIIHTQKLILTRSHINAIKEGSKRCNECAVYIIPAPKG